MRKDAVPGSRRPAIIVPLSLLHLADIASGDRLRKRTGDRFQGGTAGQRLPFPDLTVAGEGRAEMEIC